MTSACCCTAAPVVPPAVLWVSQWTCCYSGVPCSQPAGGGTNCGLVKVWTCKFVALDPIKDASIYAQFYPPNPAQPGSPTPPTCTAAGCSQSTTPSGQRNPCGNTASECPQLSSTFWWALPVPTYTIPQPVAGQCNACGPTLDEVNTVWISAQAKPCKYYVPERLVFYPGQ
jgi:hypothetical protein